MRFAYLGSGSQGNGLVVEAGRTRVLLDCGFPLRETVRRLARLGLEASDLAGIVVTHEHDDHVGGVARLARKYALPVWITRGTYRAVADDFREVQVRLIEGYAAFAVDDLEVVPYPVPHDAEEPGQVVFSDGGRRLGVLTDAGCSTPHIERMLSGCDALALECNHDLEMLRRGNYPATLKQRIAGRLGHLDNASAGRLLGTLDRRRLQHLVAVHLSLQNNTAALARASLAGAAGCETDWVAVADQFEGLDWRQIT